jgi:4-amino-4-deoxychorismate lyase
MSRLIETIRFADGSPENLGYHLRRMNDSSQELFGDTLNWKPKYLIQDLKLPKDTVYKVRLVYDLNKGSITTSPYTIKPVRSLKLVTDNDIVYDHKFEDRSNLDRLFSAKGDCDDILIIKNGLVTDVSYANIIFREGNQWYTPESFLLNGTMRQKLLDTGRIVERPITVDDLGRYSHFRLINAMLREDAPESEILNIR